MGEKKKSEEVEGKGFRLEELGDQEFEAFVAELLDNSFELKEKYKYTEARLIEGGSDRGKDCILYNDENIVGIVQCKHSTNPNAMSKTIIVKEILKMLLYLYIEPQLLPTNTKKYLFFISSKLTPASYDYLKKFKKNELEDREKLKKSILSLRNTNVLIKKNITEKDLKEKLYLDLEQIFDSLEKDYLTNMQIQTYLSSSNSIIGLIISKYFKVKKVIVKEEYEFPRIKIDEGNNYKEYNEERFHGKLQEILANDTILEDALKAYSSKILCTVELLKINPLYIKEDLMEYQNVIENKEVNLRQEKIIDLQIENFEEKRLLLEYLKHYLNTLREVDKCRFRNFDYIPPEFARGTVQELVNIEKIYDWILLKEEKNSGNDNDGNN